MKMLREKSVVISLISAIFFAVFYVSTLLGNMKFVGSFPLWFSIFGAITMCYIPIYVIQVGGSKKGALLFAVIVLLVSGAHLLTLVEGSSGLIHDLLEYRPFPRS